MSVSKIKISKSPIEKRPGCIQSAIEILGDKWSPLLLGELTGPAQTFGELELSLTGISPRTLSSRLEMLQCNGVLNKKLYCTHPPRYKYELTKKGKDLLGIINEMADWGNKYHTSSAS